MLHIPVLTDQIKQCLSKSKYTILDVTFGFGGHSRLLKSLGHNVICLDCDPESIKYNNNEFKLINDKFSNISKYFNTNSVDYILADLGVSSMQIDNPSRGFSYYNSGPLDMRMNNTFDEPLQAKLKKLNFNQIKEILKTGELKNSHIITKNIIEYRISNDINTTNDLIIASKLKDYRDISVLFQAFRMYINNELYELESLLRTGYNIARYGMLIISFHSLEDRIVKQFFKRNYPTSELYIPTHDEILLNIRSRSAKLRFATKLN